MNDHLLQNPNTSSPSKTPNLKKEGDKLDETALKVKKEKEFVSQSTFTFHSPQKWVGTRRLLIVIWWIQWPMLHCATCSDPSWYPDRSIIDWHEIIDSPNSSQEARRQELLKPSMKQLYSEEMAALARDKERFERELKERLRYGIRGTVENDNWVFPAGRKHNYPHSRRYRSWLRWGYVKSNFLGHYRFSEYGSWSLISVQNKPDDLKVAMDRLVENMKKIGSTVRFFLICYQNQDPIDIGSVMFHAHTKEDQIKSLSPVNVYRQGWRIRPIITHTPAIENEGAHSAFP